MRETQRSEALRRIQCPWDIAWDQNWVIPSINTALKILIDAGVFTKWAAEREGAPITCSILAQLTGADELFIRISLLLKSVIRNTDIDVGVVNL